MHTTTSMPKEQPFKNREITAMFSRIEEKLDSHTDVHNQILTQTTEHNHRMSKMEKWRERINGGMVASMFIIPLVLGGIGWAMVNIINIQIKSAVSDALTVYEQP